MKKVNRLIKKVWEKKKKVLKDFFSKFIIIAKHNKVSLGILGLIFLFIFIIGFTFTEINQTHKVMKQKDNFFIESIHPNSESLPHPIDKPLEIVFTHEIYDIDLLSRNIDIEPDAKFTVKVDLESPRKIIINPVDKFKTNTQYKVTILAGEYGPNLTLEENYEYYFLTQSDFSNSLTEDTIFWVDSLFNEKHTYRLYVSNFSYNKLGLAETPEEVHIKLHRTRNSEALRALEEFAYTISNTEENKDKMKDYVFKIDNDLAEEIYSTNIKVMPTDYGFVVKLDLPIEESGVYYAEASVSGKVVTTNFILINSYGLQSRTLKKDHFITAQSLRDSKVIPGAKINGYIFKEGKGLTKTVELETNSNGQVSFADDISHDLDVITSEFNGELTIDSVGNYPLGVSNVDIEGREYHNGLNAHFSSYLSPFNYKYNIITDRDVYKPGETIYYKVLGRYNQKGSWQIKKRNINIIGSYYGAEHVEVDFGSKVLNEFGVANGQYTIPENNENSYFFIWVEDPEFDYHFARKTVGVVDFEKPQYEISVELDKNAYKNGDNVNARIKAMQYDGTLVKNTKIKVNISTNPLSPYKKNDYKLCDKLKNNYVYYPEKDLEYVESKEIELDENGNVEVNFTVNDAVVNYLGEVSVTAILGDNYGSRSEGAGSAIFHSTEHYLATYMDQSHVESGKEAYLNTEIYTPNCEPIPNKTGAFKVTEYNYDRQDSTIVYEREFTTNNFGKAETPIILEKSGQHKIITSVPSFQNEIEDSTYLWIFNNNDLFQEYFNEGNTIAIDLNKEKYSVGETATATVYHPGLSGDLWVTINRNFMHENKIIRLDKYKSEIQFVIKDEYVPTANFEISLFSNNRYYHAEKEIKVETITKEVNIKIQPNKKIYKPGEKAVFKINTSNQGIPVKSNLAVAIVDKASLDIQTRGNFWGEISLMESFYNKNHRETLDSNSLEVVNYGIMQGRGSGGDEPRNHFTNTAYWNPEIITDSDGNATFTAEMPDNLTKWAVIAWAITEETKVGEETAFIQTATDLKIQTFIPEQITKGDTMEVYATVFNLTNQAQSFNIQIQPSNEFRLLNSNDSYPIDLPVGSQKKVSWTITALSESNNAKILIETKGGDAYDGIEKTINILDKTYYNFQSYSGIGGNSFRINNSGVRDQELIISVVDSIPKFLQKLSNVPINDESYVDTINTVIGHNIYYKNVKFLKGGKSTIDYLNKNIEKRLNQYLSQAKRTSDGGFWPRNDKSPYNAQPIETLKAYAALSHAVSIGFKNYQGNASSALSWLKANARSNDEKALVLMYETEFSQNGSKTEFSNLYSNRGSMNPLGLASLLISAQNLQLSTESKSIESMLISKMKTLNGTNYWEGVSIFNSENFIDPTNIGLYALAKSGNVEEAKKAALWIFNNYEDLNNHNSLFPIKPFIEKGFIELDRSLNQNSNWNITLNGKKVLSSSISAINSVTLKDLDDGDSEINIDSGGSDILVNIIYKERSKLNKNYNSTIVDKNVSLRDLNGNKIDSLKEGEYGFLNIEVNSKIITGFPDIRFLLPPGIEFIDNTLSNSKIPSEVLQSEYYKSKRIGDIQSVNGEIIFKNSVTYKLGNVEFIYPIRGRSAGSYTLGPVNSFLKNNPNIWDTSKEKTITVVK